MTYLLIFFASLVITIFLLPYFIAFLETTKILDYPEKRKIHTQPIPKMGGLIIFFITVIMINAFSSDFNSIKYLLISASVLVFSGIVDDVLGMNNFLHFIIQNISAVILILFLEQFYSGVSLFGYQFSSPYNYLILITFILWIINSINYLDGLDGLASGFSALVFIVLLPLAIKKQDFFIILLIVSILGSTLGFLRFNAFPAKVFLGATGSLVLGFFLIVTTFLTSINYHESVLDLTLPLIILGVPLIDSLKVFILRIIRKRDPFNADNSHQHHILKRSLENYRVTVFVIELLSLLFIFLSLLYLKDYRLQAVILFFLFSGIIVALHPLLNKFNIAKIFHTLHYHLYEYPIKNIFLIIQIMLSIATFFVVFVSILSFSFTTSLNVDEILYLLFAVLSLLGLVYFQSKNLDGIGEIYVFLNFAIFFIISKLSLPSVLREEISLAYINNLRIIGFYFLSAMLAFTLVLRWKALMTQKLFFTTADLLMIIFVILSFMLSNVLQFDLNYYLSNSLLEAFIFYIWFKLVADLYKSIEFKLTVATFILPMSLLLTLLIAIKF